MAVIDRVKPHQGGEQPPVRLGQARAAEIAAGRQPLVQQVEGFEERDHRLLIGGLRRGEARAIDAVVEGGVDALVQGVDLGAQIGGIVIAEQGPHAVEGAVEHADDLGGFVVDDPPGLPVEQHGHGDPARVIGMGGAIDLVHEPRAEDGVDHLGCRRPVGIFALRPLPSAAKAPILNIFHQTSGDGIVFDVSARIIEMSLVAHEPVKIVALPEPSLATKKLVDLLRGIALPRLNDPGEREPLVCADQHMHMVGHHHIGMEVVGLADAVMQSFDDDGGYVRAA